jgi:phosphoglycerol transferase
MCAFRASFGDSRARFTAEVLLAAVLSLVALALDTSILGADFRVPISAPRDGDGLFVAAVHFKATVENGWYFHNPFLGSPYGADFREFPVPDLFYLGLIKLLGSLTNSWPLTYNLVIVGGFPLAAASAFGVLRGYGLRLVPALAAGVLFAFLPFHQWRLYGHAHLAFSYFAVPLVSIPAIEILRGAEVIVAVPAERAEGFWRRLPPIARSKASLGIACIAVCTGLWGFVYFPFFAVTILLLAAVAKCVETRSAFPLYRAVACAALTAVAFVAQMAPTLAYLHANGRVGASLRAASDAETFGLKIIQLITPLKWHRIEALRSFRQVYDLTAPLANENASAYLGLVGAFGFLILVAIAPMAARFSDERRTPLALLGPLAILNFFALVLGTIGGVGAVLAYVGLTEVRCYNRVSVFIGFYALFAVAVLFDRLISRLKAPAARTAATVGIAALVPLGVYDQTYEDGIDYAAFARDYREDDDFVRRVEGGLPTGARILQLPYISFPESGRVVALEDYAHLLGYLHGRELAWSYGALRGRLADERYRQLSRVPSAEIPDEAALAGYQAIWVDPRGLPDGAKELGTALRRALGEPFAASAQGIAVWSLVDHVNHMRESLGTRFDQLARDRREAAVLGFHDGFHARQEAGGEPFVFADRRAKLFVVNPSDHRATLVFHTRIRTARLSPPPSTLVIEGDVLRERLAIGPVNQEFERTIEVPPGTHLLSFRCDAPPDDLAYDPRRRVFVLEATTLRVR